MDDRLNKVSNKNSNSVKIHNHIFPSKYIFTLGPLSILSKNKSNANNDHQDDGYDNDSGSIRQNIRRQETLAERALEFRIADKTDAGPGWTPPSREKFVYNQSPLLKRGHRLQ